MIEVTATPRGKLFEDGALTIQCAPAAGPSRADLLAIQESRLTPGVFFYIEEAQTSGLNKVACIHIPADDWAEIVYLVEKTFRNQTSHPLRVAEEFQEIRSRYGAS